MLDNIKAVIFDLDGTLVKSLWVWRDIDLLYLEEYDQQAGEEVLEEIEGMSFTESAQFFKEKFDLKESIEEIKDKWIEMAYERYSEKVELVDGAREFIEYLKSKNIKVGIGTSNSRELAEATLRSNGVLGFVDAFMTSCEVGKGKPNPDIFLGVAKCLGVEPSECLVFEDTYAGMLAGVRAGMKVYGVKEDASVKNIEKIEELVEEYIEDYYELGVLVRSV